VKNILVCAALIALSACGQQATPTPTPTATPTPTDTTPALPPPDKASFAALYKKACPTAKPVNAVVCQSEGFGKEGFVCKFGFDGYARYSATVEPSDGQWALADADKACATGAAS
jgi:hypothetical protein